MPSPALPAPPLAQQPGAQGRRRPEPFPSPRGLSHRTPGDAQRESTEQVWGQGTRSCPCPGREWRTEETVGRASRSHPCRRPGNPTSRPPHGPTSVSGGCSFSSEFKVALGISESLWERSGRTESEQCFLCEAGRGGRHSGLPASDALVPPSCSPRGARAPAAC